GERRAIGASHSASGQLRGSDLQRRGGVHGEHGRTARGAPGRVTHNYSELCSAIGAGGGGGGVSGRGRAADGNAIFLPLVSQGSGAGSGHGKSSCLARGGRSTRLHYSHRRS